MAIETPAPLPASGEAMEEHGAELFVAFGEESRADQLGMVDLNNRLVVGLTHRFLADLISTRGGVINVASLSSYMPMPYLAIYSATKAVVKVFTKMLAVEMSGKAVRFTRCQ